MSIYFFLLDVNVIKNSSFIYKLKNAQRFFF